MVALRLPPAFSRNRYQCAMYPGRRFALPWAISFCPFGAAGSMAGFQGREQIGFAKVVLVLEFQYILHFLAGHLADNRPDQTANFPGDFPGVFPSTESDRDSELFIGLPKWVV